MDSELKKLVVIKTDTAEEELKVATSIHEQLVGNEDYKENRIILNLSKDRDDDTENEVHLYIFNDCKSSKEIKINI